MDKRKGKAVAMEDTLQELDNDDDDVDADDDEDLDIDANVINLVGIQLEDNRTCPSHCSEMLGDLPMHEDKT